MRIIELHLKGYTRLSLGNINELILTPQDRLTIVLGSNGSGKSSVLKELTPLPANITKEYGEGGFKRIIISYRNKMYILTSGVGGRNKHSFIVDGKELNEGGTRKVQLQLVLDHFNITPEIHEILLGLNNFTTMNVAERKKWFTNISDIDYSYSLNVYMKLKQRHRDLTGAIKIQQSKLTKIEDAVISNEDRDVLLNNLKALKELQDILLTSKDNVVYNQRDDIDKVLLPITNKAMILTNTVKKIYHIDTNELVTSNNIKNFITLAKAELATITRNKKEHEELLALLIKTENSSSSQLETINANIASLNTKISDIVKDIYLDININNIEAIRLAYNDAYDNILAVLNDLGGYTDVSLTAEEYTKVSNQILSYENNVGMLNSNIIKNIELKKHLEHLRTHNKVTCKQCDNSWSVGFSNKEYNKCVSDLELFGKKLVEIEDKLSKLNVLKERYDERQVLIDMFKLRISNYSITKPIWIYIIDKFSIIKQTSMFIDEMFKVKEDLTKWFIVKTYNEELDELKNEKILAERSKDLEDRIKDKDRNVTEEGIHVFTERVNKLNIFITELYKYKTIMQDIIMVNHELKVTLKNGATNVKQELAQLRNTSINKLVTDVRLMISDIEQKLSESDYYYNNLEGTRKEIAELIVREKTLKILVQEMSPTEGLIAKSISSFLKVFTDDINHIINSVWSYSLEVLPCTIDGANDLDYKFPALVDERTLIEDVSKTSASMNEIIDLAFKIVSMKYLGIETFPLYLDEFTRTMDTVHRLKSYEIIDTLSNSSFEQIFLVSHFETCYTRFKNSDIVVISEDNLLLDNNMVFNETLKLK